MQPEGMTRLLVEPRFDGVRLDVFLAGATPLSRRAARRLSADGLVWRNGEALRVLSRTVTTGDVIDVLRPPEELGLARQPQLPPVDVLYRDGWLLVANKPAGMLTAPAENMAADELALDHLVMLTLALEAGRRPFVRLVHRLDRVTTGAVLFALAPEALPRLTVLWSRGKVERRYLAVVEGRPTWTRDLIELSISRDRSHRWKFQAGPGGRPARTEARVLSCLDDGLAVVECRLDTGRTHQVRVHLAARGHPVLGDRLYGSQRPNLAPRPLLHAWSLALPHPSTGERLEVVCPPPADIGRYLPTNS
jgi:23S rRNA pseudouridine1911/1915/1917 synthase